MFLGVDGGGTKTALCLLDGEGRVLAQARAGGMYYVSAGIELVDRVLRDGIG
ncbi:N-acetylglucosamine kinase, partial [Lacticaseibacillus rhamnosus]